MRSASVIRPPAVAGVFYPAHPGKLAAQVDRLLDHARPPVTDRPPVALVVPHAGYAYSGPVAATAYATLRAAAPEVDRVVLVGPAHFVPVPGMALPAAQGFDTPLGPVEVDRAVVEMLAGEWPDDVAVDDAPHRPEHSLEVQLPFLRRALGADWTMVPVLVGGSPPQAVADVLDHLCSRGASRSLLVVSTDLSHHLDAATAQRRDQVTADAIVAGRDRSIGTRDACGAYALRAMLAWVARHRRTVALLDLRTSADTAGDPARVVGYGAFRVD